MEKHLDIWTGNFPVHLFFELLVSMKDCNL